MSRKRATVKREAAAVKRSKPRDPATRLEWQEAVNAAYFLLSLASARAYGLAEGGPEVDEDRCRRILEDGKARWVIPCSQYCRVCGCTYDDPCDEGCYWVEADLCSQCARKQARKRRVRGSSSSPKSQASSH